MKILVVEDEVKIAKLIKRGLEMDNFEVDIVYDGNIGLETARRGAYDLLVLDVMLPGVEGTEICKILRKEGMEMPILMLTARDTVGDKILGMESGADEYMIKPFSLNELSTTIKSLIKYNKAKKNIVAMEDLDEEDLEKGELPQHQDEISAYDAEEKLDMELSRKFLDNAPMSVVLIDANGFIKSANKYYKNFSKTGHYLNHNIFESEFFKRENLIDDYKKLFQDGTFVRKDRCFELNNKGEEKYLNIVAVPLKDKDGNIEGALSMATDNTESVVYRNKLKQANEELETRIQERTRELDKVNEELSEVLKLKSTFMADVSHEMRTSLAIIQCNLELITRQLVVDKVNQDPNEESYQHIFSEIRRMSTMLEDLTLLATTNSSKQMLECGRVDLNEKIMHVCKSLKVLADEKNISIKYDNPFGNLEIHADENKIEKLLINLIKNAIRYNNPDGWIHITVEKEENRIILKVKDGGIGIAQEHLPYIFERFYRADKARSRNEGGSGLGLAICEWVVKSHGGAIFAESKIGSGSLFTVQLPNDCRKNIV